MFSKLKQKLLSTFNNYSELIKIGKTICIIIGGSLIYISGVWIILMIFTKPPTKEEQNRMRCNITGMM